MKKKTIKVAGFLLLCLTVLLLVWDLADPATVCVGNRAAALSLDDSMHLRWLLLMKETDFYEYACGFSEDYSVKIGGLTYCLAQDDCNSVYIKELDFYYIIYEGNHIKPHELLTKYM